MIKKWAKPALIILTIIILIIAVNIKREHTPVFIESSLKQISNAVNNGDEKGFLNMIDESNPEFYAEERHMFQDIKLIGLQDFRMVAKGVRKLGANEYLVKVQQSYYEEKTKKSVTYDAVLKQYGSVCKFNDLYFKTIEKKYFIIKYQPSLEKDAVRLAGFIDQVHDNVKNIYGKAPEDKTVIKIYNNNDVFNTFIKPSIRFRMAGWYEYPESIKINMSSKLSRLLPDAEFKRQYYTVLSHELTHRINSMETKNNIPYWLAEGIATYVENSGRPNLEAEGRHIAVLEKINLEELTDTGEIEDYYNDSYINTSMIIKKYGLEGLHEILGELGKYPLEESTQGVVYLESNKKFHEVVRKLYNIDLDQFDEQIRK